MSNTGKIERNILRSMVIDSVVCQTAPDFLARWKQTLIDNPEYFGPVYSLDPKNQGAEMLRKIREIVVSLDKGNTNTSKPEGAKPARQMKEVQVVIFEDGQPKLSKGFDRWWDAQKWAARKIADVPYHHATINGKRMDSIEAARFMYSRIGGSPAMKTRTFNTSGPWQKAQQTKASFSKG